MRKLLPYIFIAIILVGLFSPVLPFSHHSEGVALAKVQENGAFQAQLSQFKCVSWKGGISMPGCLVQFVHVFFYSIPAFLLWLVAQIFNIMLYVSISGDMIRDKPFINEAWSIVRDLSNLFFIFILLFVAIKIILDLGAGEAKKMIVRVVIAALLINFSMFFTRVVIDSSNVLALIFYNKLDTPATYTPLKNEKDLSGALTENFDPTTSIDQTTS